MKPKNNWKEKWIFFLNKKRKIGMKKKRQIKYEIRRKTESKKNVKSFKWKLKFSKAEDKNSTKRTKLRILKMKETKKNRWKCLPFRQYVRFVFNEAKPSTYDISSHASPWHCYATLERRMPEAVLIKKEKKRSKIRDKKKNLLTSTR